MGLDNLVRAMKKVVAQYPKALLLLGGKGPEKERLEGIIAELGLGDNVRLLGFISDDDLADYFRAANLFVLPTVALEGFGLVTVEALASGTPVIGTPVGGTVEILSGLDRRLLSSSTEADALAEAIVGFLGSPLRQELTPERLHQFILDKYTWDRHVSKIEALYNRLREAKKA
jgi:glycosyltransferase involved in cell wall biosynthesis